MNPPDDPKLERLIHRTLRDLPDRRAPRTLEARVLAAIERRASLPWWRLSFAHWPLPARAVFLLASAGLVKLALMATVWVRAGFDAMQVRAALSDQFAWVESATVVLRTLGDFVGASVRMVPAPWLYGGLTVVAALYVALFGLGAAAYRALYVNRS
jgi:hypothetical protein